MSHDNEIIRPGTIVLWLVLMSITTLFIGLSAAYLYTLFSTDVEAPKPPLLFLINIPVLYASTVALKKGMTAFDANARESMRKNLMFCLFLTVAFVCIQIFGWILFFRTIPIAATQARSFLFVLSGMHLLHVLAGIPFLMRFLWAHRNVLTSMMATATYQRGFLRGLIRYWNFLDILWILLVVMLSVGYGLQWL